MNEEVNKKETEENGNHFPEDSHAPQPANFKTASMEVHKHPHHITHSKKWFEYLLEFLMIFFAVFLGFIAENIRENIVERKKEKEYLHSFIKDLQSDTADINHNLKLGTIVSEKSDSLIRIINAGHADSLAVDVYRLARVTSRVVNVNFEDRTTSQLKTTGMVLIRNEAVADSIRKYWERRKTMEEISGRLSGMGDKVTDIAVQLLNVKYYPARDPNNPFSSFGVNTSAKLLKNDQNLLAEYANRESEWLGVLYNYLRYMRETKSEALELMKVIRDQYHFDE